MVTGKMKAMLIMCLACVISQSFFLYTGGNSWDTNGGGVVTDSGYSFTSLPASFETYFYVGGSTGIPFNLSMFIRTSQTITCNLKFNFQAAGTKSIGPLRSLREVSLGVHTSLAGSYNKMTITLTGTIPATSGLVQKFNINGVFTNLAYVTDSYSFYRGRTGASGRLNMELSGSKIYYFYSEMLVGQAPIGSYFIANGFEQGQFGLQVNSETQRRVVFSVQSGYQGKNTQQIPAQYSVELIKLGPGVTRANCRSQGSGGKSFLRFDWALFTGYKFLVKAEPLTNNATTFTAWFGDPTNTTTDGWRLIASWTRPKVKTLLTGIYHSNEPFSPDHGNQRKLAFYKNQRYFDQTETWKEVSQLTFNQDETGNQNQRKDTNAQFSGGYSGGPLQLTTNRFSYLHDLSGSNKFTRTLSGEAFSIDFAALPF